MAENKEKRVIKFRGLYKGTMVYGDLIHKTVGDKSYVEIENNDANDYMNWTVDPETVGQFTGLHDKDGNVEIFEGDLIGPTGEVIGSCYENTLHTGSTNLLITGLCTKNWRDTEEEAIARGCRYAE